jgi:C1A family cysteine protease
MSRFLPRWVAPVDRVDHRHQLPPVMNQGRAGTCVACATAYYDKGYQEGREHRWDLTRREHQFSPLFVYLQRHDRTGDHGMTLREAMRIVYREGVCTWADLPYDWRGVMEPLPGGLLPKARPFRARSYARLTSLADMVSYLSDNCFVAGLLVFDSFVSGRDGNIPMPAQGESLLGGHAVCVCGFDLDSGHFRFANSWGPRWGEAGFGRIRFDVFQALLMDAWGMVDAPDIARAA